MTKKDYEEIADIIRDNGSRLDNLYIADTEKLMRSLCKYFKRDNKSFIPKKFRERARPTRMGGELFSSSLNDIENRRI